MILVHMQKFDHNILKAVQYSIQIVILPGIYDKIFWIEQFKNFTSLFQRLIKEINICQCKFIIEFDEQLLETGTDLLFDFKKPVDCALVEIFELNWNSCDITLLTLPINKVKFFVQIITYNMSSKVQFNHFIWPHFLFHRTPDATLLLNH